MSKATPAWLAETKQYCDSAGIPIIAWGPNLLTVEARGIARAKEVAAQMGALGFQEIPCAGNIRAGLLDLSKDPVAPTMPTFFMSKLFDSLASQS